MWLWLKATYATHMAIENSRSFPVERTKWVELLGALLNLARLRASPLTSQTPPNAVWGRRRLKFSPIDPLKLSFWLA
jgi:hypothetical protein